MPGTLEQMLTDHRREPTRGAREPRFRVEPNFEESYPGASALATECVLNLTYVFGALRSFAEGLVRRYGFPSMAAFNALEIVRGAAQPLLPSIIAERMVLSRGRTTAVLDGLEQRGLVSRTPHTSDGRMRLVEITAKGAEQASRVLPELHSEEKRVLGALSGSEQAQLLQLLAGIQSRLPPERA